MAMNQTCYAINGNGINEYFTHQLALDTISRLKNEAVGAIFAALVTRDFDGQMVIEPSKKLIEGFGEKVSAIYRHNLNITCQNQKLTNLKDLLLSKLATISD